MRYTVTEYCKVKLTEKTIAVGLSKKDAHTLRELLNSYAKFIVFPCYFETR